MKFLILALIIFSFIHVGAQEIGNKGSVKNKITLGLASTLNNSRYCLGDNNKIYKELTIDYGIRKYISTGVYLGHQERDYSFVSAPANSPMQIYQYTQTFVPAGLRLSLHLTSFAANQLGIKINEEKFDVYITYFAGATFTSVENKFSPNTGPGYVVDYTNYRADEDINYKAGLLTGIRYIPVKNFGVFLEGGLGTMGNVNFGVLARF